MIASLKTGHDFGLLVDIPTPVEADHVDNEVGGQSRDPRLL